MFRLCWSKTLETSKKKEMGFTAFALAAIVAVSLIIALEGAPANVHSVLIKSCSGLNKYPALRDFLKKEVTKDMYENMKVEWKSGAVPTAYFFDENGKQIMEEVVGNLKKDEIAEFFASRGFTLSKKKTDYDDNGGSVAEYDGHEYELFLVENGYSVAREFATSRVRNGKKGYILQVTSASEQEFVDGMLRDFGAKVSTVWVGANDDKEEGQWRWDGSQEAFYSGLADGHGTSYSNWKEIEPNNGNGFENEDCVVIQKTSATATDPRRWNDVNCDSLASLVVEYGDSPQNVDPPQEGRLLVEDVPDEL